jgi:hypothetical protein
MNCLAREETGVAVLEPRDSLIRRDGRLRVFGENGAGVLRSGGRCAGDNYSGCRQEASSCGHDPSGGYAVATAGHHDATRDS